MTTRSGVASWFSAWGWLTAQEHAGSNPVPGLAMSLEPYREGGQRFILRAGVLPTRHAPPPESSNAFGVAAALQTRSQIAADTLCNEFAEAAVPYIIVIVALGIAGLFGHAVLKLDFRHAAPVTCSELWKSQTGGNPAACSTPAPAKLPNS